VVQLAKNHDGNARVVGEAEESPEEGALLLLEVLAQKGPAMFGGLRRAGEAAKQRVLDPPPLQPGESVLWEAQDKRTRFTIKRLDNGRFVLTVQKRLDALDEPERGISKAEVREIVERMISLAQL
jgi:hypothetical protein